MEEVEVKPLPSLTGASINQLVNLLSTVRKRREYIASIDTRGGKMEAHITAELKAKMLAEQTKTVKITGVGSVSMVDTPRSKTSDAPKFLAWWKTNKLQPLIDAGEDVSPALAWFSKNADTEMIKLELEETGHLPDGIDQTSVVTLRFTPAKPNKGA